MIDVKIVDYWYEKKKKSLCFFYTHTKLIQNVSVIYLNGKDRIKKNLVENTEYLHNPKIGKKIICTRRTTESKNKQKANGISAVLSSDIFFR